MITIRVTFPEHVRPEHSKAYLDELIDFGSWCIVDDVTYIVRPHRPSRVADLVGSLENAARLKRLSYVIECETIQDGD
jgi:hypothetical protein